MSDFIHYRQNRNSDFFGSVEVEVFTEQGKPCILQIQNVEYRENKVTFENGKPINSFMVNGRAKERAIILYFQGQKPWICNPTNCKILERLTKKKNAKEWIGLKIELYVDYNVKFDKKIVCGVRVREQLPNVQLPKLEIDTPEFEKCLNAILGNFTISDLRKKYEINEEIEMQLLAKKEEKK